MEGLDALVVADTDVEGVGTDGAVAETAEVAVVEVGVDAVVEVLDVVVEVLDVVAVD